jgi:hypothetical protein
MESFANGNAPGTSTTGPYAMTIAGIPLNSVPGLWDDGVPHGGIGS